MMEALKWIVFSMLGLFAVYVLTRIISRATFLSWFEIKKEFENKSKKEKE